MRHSHIPCTMFSYDQGCAQKTMPHMRTARPPNGHVRRMLMVALRFGSAFALFRTVTRVMVYKIAAHNEAFSKRPKATALAATSRFQQCAPDITLAEGVQR